MSERYSTKRKLSPESMDSSEHRLMHLVQQLESKYTALEVRFNRLSREFQAMKSLNQRIQHGSSTVEINSDIDGVEALSNDFETRFAFVEVANRDLVERVDTCQQKNDCMESLLLNIQQRLDKVGIGDETTNNSSQTVIMENRDEDRTTTTTSEPRDNISSSFDLIEQTLCQPFESQIKLSTDEIQYGLFDVCEKYNLILIKEKDKLKLFNHQKQIDERRWGELGKNNFGTAIHWCSFLDCFLILYRFQLCTLSLKRNPTTSEMQFDQLNHIHPIRVIGLKFDTTIQNHNAVELLRDITSSANLPNYLFLNRGYRRIEKINTNSWQVTRGWSKHDLAYAVRDEIKSITCSLDGTYIAFHINWNGQVRFIDFRKTDGQMTLMKTIRMHDDSISLRQRIQLPFDPDHWVVIDDEPRIYIASSNPTLKDIVPIRATHLQATDQTTIYMRFVSNEEYLMIASITGDRHKKHGVLSFYKVPDH